MAGRSGVGGNDPYARERARQAREADKARKAAEAVAKRRAREEKLAYEAARAQDAVDRTYVLESDVGNPAFFDTDVPLLNPRGLLLILLRMSGAELVQLLDALLFFPRMVTQRLVEPLAGRFDVGVVSLAPEAQRTEETARWLRFVLLPPGLRGSLGPALGRAEHRRREILLEPVERQRATV
ncbi:hypothetical protein ACIQY8_28240 [Streptomyces albidoflavus]